MIFMAWGAKVALESGSGKTIEVDCIHVRVGNRLSGIHKILVYPYRIIEGKVDLMDIMKPIAKEV